MTPMRHPVGTKRLFSQPMKILVTTVSYTSIMSMVWLLCTSVICSVSNIATGLHVANTVPLLRLVEQSLKFSANTNKNPWAVQDCNAEIRPPLGSRYENLLSVALFFDGRSQNTDTYAFRFVPDCAGSWNWTLSCPKLTLAPGEPSSGIVEAASSANDGRGGVLRASKNPQFLEREDGSRWTPIGFVRVYTSIRD